MNFITMYGTTTYGKKADFHYSRSICEEKLYAKDKTMGMYEVVSCATLSKLTISNQCCNWEHDEK